MKISGKNFKGRTHCPAFKRLPGERDSNPESRSGVVIVAALLKRPASRPERFKFARQPRGRFGDFMNWKGAKAGKSFLDNKDDA
jgi:hypothetical protein